MRQVSIETRVVIVNDDYERDLGVRFGATVVKNNTANGLLSMTGTGAGSDTDRQLGHQQPEHATARRSRSPRRRSGSATT